MDKQITTKFCYTGLFNSEAQLTDTMSSICYEEEPEYKLVSWKVLYSELAVYAILEFNKNIHN